MVKSILSEIRQTRPFRSPQEQAVINMMRTSRAIEESWLTYLKRTEGISLSQYNILRILRGAHPESVKISQIAERMIYHDPDVTRLVDRLVGQGVALRERDTQDRRVVFVSITKAGLTLLERLDEPVDRYSHAVMAGLTVKQLRELEALLDHLRAGLQPFP
jgi:DNA-binding MarR family transcriptional regulator